MQHLGVLAPGLIPLREQPLLDYLEPGRGGEPEHRLVARHHSLGGVAEQLQKLKEEYVPRELDTCDCTVAPRVGLEPTT